MVWNQIQFVAIHSNTTPRFNKSEYPRPDNLSQDLIQVRRFTITPAAELLENVIRGILIPARLLFRVLITLFLLDQLVYPGLLATVLPRKRSVAFRSVLTHCVLVTTILIV